MKIPKLQTAWTTIPSDVTSSNWSVRLALQQAALLQQQRFAQAVARLRREDQRREDARRNQATVTADNRTTALRNQDLQQAAVKTVLIRKEQEKANNLQRFGQVTDATIKLTRPSTYMGYALTDKPFGEGFGNETANIAGDLLATPLASLTRRGFQYASDIIPRVAQFRVSNYTRNWTRFGNNMYRLKPGYAFSGIPLPFKNVEKRPISEIFEQERWNRFRNPKYVTEADKIELKSHFPEYKIILERAMDEGNYMIVPENSPLSKMSTQLDDGRLLFTGDQGTWILSQSLNFKTRQNGTITKVGFKGGIDQKGIEGVKETHAPETFPDQENGVFFAGPREYADTYNNGLPSPGYWLFFKNPYNMLDGGKRAFPLENNTVRFVRGVMSSPSYKGGEVPILTYNTINKAWNAEYLNNPEIIEFLSRDPNKMSSSELIKRDNLLKTIRQGQLSENEGRFNKGVESMIKSGKLLPLRSLYYDGFIGRDHTLGWSPQKDLKWSFGSNPETYVIFRPELAKLLVGNNGSFGVSTAYSRKKGGKLNIYQKN